MNSFGEWFQAMARGLGYTRDTDVARALGVSPSTVGRWRRGSRPSVQELVTISRTFNVHLEALLVLVGLVERDEVGRAEPPPPPRPVNPAQRMIENAPLDEDSKEVLRTYWTSRMNEEHYRLDRLIEMTVGPAEDDSFARYVARGEVSDPVLRHIREVTDSTLNADVLRVLTHALARNFRMPKRSRRSALQAAAERRVRAQRGDEEEKQSLRRTDPENSSFSCYQVMVRRDAFFDGKLTREEDSAVRRHIYEVCDRCRELYQRNDPTSDLSNMERAERGAREQREAST